MIDIRQKDTIFAQSSALGPSAIALVRLSGSLIPNIIKSIFPDKKNIKPFVAHKADLINVDEVVFTYFKAPKSFTGQDVLEINCHGNQVIINEIYSLLRNHGCRLAEPGEFSLRAVLNNKIDLLKAESILGLIHAESTKAKNVALRNLKSGLKEKIMPIRDIIIDCLAQMESRMDFPEDDLGSYDKSFLIERISSSIFSLEAILKSAEGSLKLFEGVRIVIAGLPNAGKSTLLNAILNQEKAIVHDTPGTTRDVLEGKIDLFGIPATIVDIAGIRALNEADSIEQIGIKKALRELEKASLIIWLADAYERDPFDDDTLKEKFANLSVPILKVLNKTEKLSKESLPKADFYISAAQDINIDDLLKHTFELLKSDDADTDELFITKSRQKEDLALALDSLKMAKCSLADGLVDEVVTSELRMAGSHLDRLLGLQIDEEILDKIFSEFCIGK